MSHKAKPSLCRSLRSASLHFLTPRRRVGAVTKPSVQDAVLLETARVQLSDAGAAFLRTCVADESIDWSAVVRLALEHGTAALLCNHLLSTASDLLPPDLRSAAESFVRMREDAGRIGAAELCRILDALQEEGICAIPFKGPLLAQQVYGDLGLRSFRDLDVLIRKDEIERAMTALARLGYHSEVEGLGARHRAAYHAYNGQDILFAEGQLPVEPHWAFAPRTFGAHLNPAELALRAEPRPIFGRVVYSLSPEDSLLVAALHGAKEQWTRLLWIADVAEMLRGHPGLDLDAVLHRAKRAGLHRIALLAISLAVCLLDAPISEPVKRMIAADRRCRLLVAKIRSRMFDDGGSAGASVFQISSLGWHMRERRVDRLRYVLRTLTTARLQHFRMLDLPAPLAFAYPIVKVLHDHLALPLWLASKALRPHGRGEAFEGVRGTG